MAGARSVRLSVPGKVILMGEHAAVYGRPAVVAAVDRRLVVEVELGPAGGGSARGRGRGEPGNAGILPASGRPGIGLDLPDIGVAEAHAWQEVEEFASRARRRWRAFEAGEEPFRADRDRSALVRIAVGEALASLAPAASARLRERSFELRLRSAIPVGGGLGSSAAAAVGVVAAVRAVAGGFSQGAPEAGQKAGAPSAEPGALSEVLLPGVGDELAAIEAAALEVERRQHGFPSGIDSGTVLRGGVLLVRREGEELRFDDLPRPGWLRRDIVIVDSGEPEQTTGAVVASVRLNYERDPDGLSAVFDRMETAVDDFRAALASGRKRRAEVAISAAHYALVDLGVVPPRVAWRIGRVEMAGGVAKISGAGALEGESAGALVCMLGRRDPGAVEGLSDLARVDAPIGAEGLRFED